MYIKYLDRDANIFTKVETKTRKKNAQLSKFQSESLRHLKTVIGPQDT